MADSAGARELGERLAELKARSGRSYDSIGRRVNLGKSTVHRYCTGAAVPSQFAIVERIGTACGADAKELLALHRLWARATAAGDGRVPEEPQSEPTPAAPTRTTAPVLRRSLISVAATLVVLLALISSSAVAPPPAVPQWVTGPAWGRPATPVPKELFGVTINSAVGAMPSFRVGAIRLWDSGTRWSEVQRERGVHDWATLDRLVSNAEQAGLPVLFVFGGTPRWAAPNGGHTPYSDQSSSAPPDDLADWDAFVTAVVERYRGRIESYELWVLGNDERFYTGALETLVEMTRRAAAIVRGIDPNATLACPGMGRLWTEDGMAALRRFAQLGGYAHCDVASVKLFQRQASDPPESMLELTANIYRELHAVGLHPPVWNTGTTYTIPLEHKLDEAKARAYAVRFYLVGLYAHDTNLTRMYFYNWGGTRIPIVLQAVGGTPTPAALAVERLQTWLSGAHITACGRGHAMGLLDNVWQCEFTISAFDRSRHATIRWTHAGTAVTTAPTGSRAVHRIDGTSNPLRSGDPLPISDEPVMIERG